MGTYIAHTCLFYPLQKGEAEANKSTGADYIKNSYLLVDFFFFTPQCSSAFKITAW